MQDPKDVEIQKLKSKVKKLENSQKNWTRLRKIKDTFLLPVALFFYGILSFVAQFILRLLEPKVLVGVIVAILTGVAFYILFYFWQSDSFRIVVPSIVLVLIIGYFIAQRIFYISQERAKNKLKDNLTNNSDIAFKLIHTAAQIYKSEGDVQEKYKTELLKELKPLAQNFTTLGKNYVLKFITFNSFISLFTLITSVSIVIITYMQIEQLKIQNERLQEQNKLFRGQNDLFTAQNKRLDQQTYLQEAGRRSSLVFLFSNIMDAIDRELKNDYGQDSIRNLSPQLIGRIVALSTRLKPYQYLDGDTLTGKPLSPERGQLLVSLLGSKLDSTSYIEIHGKAKFDFADLENANLRDAYLSRADLSRVNLRDGDLIRAKLSGADLSGADLARAKLSDAKLSGTNLSGANLSGANLSGANLENAYMKDVSLKNAFLKNANFQNAKLRGVDLRGVDLRGVDLKGVDLKGVDLKGVDLSQSNLMNSNFQNAKLRGVDLRGADLRGADLRGADLRGVDLRGVNLRGVNLRDVDLRDVKIIDSLFFKTLINQNIQGIQELEEKYFVDLSPQYEEKDKAPPYYLIKRKQIIYR